MMFGMVWWFGWLFMVVRAVLAHVDVGATCSCWDSIFAHVDVGAIWPFFIGAVYLVVLAAVLPMYFELFLSAGICAVFFHVLLLIFEAKPPIEEMVVPRYPIRMFNVIGKLWYKVTGRHLVDINYEQLERLFEEAQWEEGFGPLKDELKWLRAAVTTFDRAAYSEFGRLCTKQRLVDVMEHRRQVVSYVKAHPEIMQIPIVKPLVIVGLHRSGTTLLSRLLAQDPAARTPHMWEMLCDVWPKPPDSKELIEAAHGRGTRLAAVQHKFDLLDKCASGGSAFRRSNSQHYLHPGQPEESLIVLTDALFLSPFEYTYGAPCEATLKEALRADNKQNVVLYLKRFLQVLSSGYMPPSHWLLKNPFTSLYLPTFMKEFPDANVVVCHRDPAVAVPSMARFHLDVDGMRGEFSNLSLRNVGLHVRDVECTVARRVAKFCPMPPKNYSTVTAAKTTTANNNGTAGARKRGDGNEGAAAAGVDDEDGWTDARVDDDEEGGCGSGGNNEKKQQGGTDQVVDALHLQMREIVADPIGTVERIYTRFGYHVSEDFLSAMKQYLANNPRYAHGKVDYSLDMFDLTEEDVDVPEYRPYLS